MIHSQLKKYFPKFSQPLDRVAIALMGILSAVIGLLVLFGSNTSPHIREFSWQNRVISAQDTAFILRFSRPMERQSVENNLKIEPPLPGRISWAGQRMAYTLNEPAPYGNRFQVSLSNAQDRFSAENPHRSGITLRPYRGEFITRDRVFAFIGTQGEEAGRLILYNLTQQEKTFLTPSNLVVMDFKPYQNRERILFAATTRAEAAQGQILEQQIYTVTTGLTTVSGQPSAPGKVDLLLDNKGYQNLKFDLTPDSQTLVVHRINRRNPGDSGLWILQPGKPAKPLENQPGGDFVMTPDSRAIAIAQGEGVAILPIQPQAEPLDFLPRFGMVLSFSNDGTAATMVKFNPDYTRSLYLVTNQGTQKELLKTTGSIFNCQFSPNKAQLYCLLSQLLEGEVYQEVPYLAAIDLQTGIETPLVALPDQRDAQLSLSPDGIALLFDQAVTGEPQAQTVGPTTSTGQTIVSSRLWLLALTDASEQTPGLQILLQPEELPFRGVRPRWLP
ncbi:MAG: hypothetical protein F6K32_10520 [Desertifilum sp. SIO1I2]|nr:hypothetical protein [Desertifilum sp. SIO1I2]